jgi:YidC/Oxa1 family membrane protein insertase
VLQPMLASEWTESKPAVFAPYPGPDALTDEQKDLAIEYRVLVQPGRESLNLQAFWGAKRYASLVDLPGNLGLEKSIRWSFFGFIALPMLHAMLWIHDNLVANFGWSIVLLTLVIKLLLAPLTHKSYVSSRKMQAVQPKMQAIKQKYRAKLKDKKGRPNLEMQRKQNEEIQALFKQEGVNPAAGCLPLLLQMPFFFSFFTLLRNSVEMYNAPWILWIHDLSARDPYYILPLIMGASQFVQQKLIGTGAMEPSQRMMMNVMPVMMMFFFFGAPSGLVLYWVTSNLLTIVQQAVFRRLKASGLVGGDESEAATGKKMAPSKK